MNFFSLFYYFNYCTIIVTSLIMKESYVVSYIHALHACAWCLYVRWSKLVHENFPMHAYNYFKAGNLTMKI